MLVADVVFPPVISCQWPKSILWWPLLSILLCIFEFPALLEISLIWTNLIGACSYTRPIIDIYTRLIIIFFIQGICTLWLDLLISLKQLTNRALCPKEFYTTIGSSTVTCQLAWGPLCQPSPNPYLRTMSPLLRYITANHSIKLFRY